MSGIAYLLSIIAANIIVTNLGIVSLLGVTFPAGAPMIGLTFTFRDMVQRRFGKLHCWWWMLGACVITVAFNPQIAYASFAAFIIAEGLDWLIYTKFNTSFSKRVIASNLVGIPLDSIVFVAVAFGWNVDAMIGQTVVKLVFGLIPLALVKFRREVWA